MIVHFDLYYLYLSFPIVPNDPLSSWSVIKLNLHLDYKKSINGLKGVLRNLHTSTAVGTILTLSVKFPVYQYNIMKADCIWMEQSKAFLMELHCIWQPKIKICTLKFALVVLRREIIFSSCWWTQFESQIETFNGWWRVLRLLACSLKSVSFPLFFAQSKFLFILPSL